MVVSVLPWAPYALAPAVKHAPGKHVEPSLPASDGAQRWVWHARYGPMLIEVIAGEIYVNGRRVEPHAS